MFDDKLLVYKIKTKDEQAFNKLYYKYAPLIKYIILDITKNNDVIDDICQIVFMKIWNNIENFKGGSFKYYMIQIAKNESKNYIRTKETEKKYLGIYDFFSNYHLDGKIWIIIRNELSELEQKIIILHFIYNINFLDIANFLNIKKTTCYNIYKEALKKLKKHIKGDEINE